MKILPVLFAFRIRRGAVARITLNGLPVYKGVRAGPGFMTGTASHLVQPGENVIELEVHRADLSGKPEGKADTVFFQLYTAENRPGGLADKTVHFTLSFPDAWQEKDERFRRLPYYHRQAFLMDEDRPVPVQMRAAPQDFGCGGTPELREAVREIHAAIAENDCARFLEAVALRFEEGERLYPGERSFVAASRRRFFQEEVFLHRFEAAPFDPDALHYEPRAGGRVAHVTRADGGFAIDAHIAGMPEERFSFDPWLTFHRGAWRMFGPGA